MAFGHEVQPPENMTVELVAPEGVATGGSSLLAVLAGYILPGSGPAPPATLMMLVLLGLILAAVYAPRPAGLGADLAVGPPRPAHGTRPGGPPTRLVPPLPWARCVLVRARVPRRPRLAQHHRSRKQG